MHISLTDKLDQYVRDKVAGGLYNNASEVIREALRRQIEAEMTQQQKREALKREIQIGIDEANRGELYPFDVEAFIVGLDAEPEAESFRD